MIVVRACQCILSVYIYVRVYESLIHRDTFHHQSPFLPHKPPTPPHPRTLTCPRRAASISAVVRPSATSTVSTLARPASAATRRFTCCFWFWWGGAGWAVGRLDWIGRCRSIGLHWIRYVHMYSDSALRTYDDRRWPRSPPPSINDNQSIHDPPTSATSPQHTARTNRTPAAICCCCCACICACACAAVVGSRGWSRGGCCVGLGVMVGSIAGG